MKLINYLAVFGICIAVTGSATAQNPQGDTELSASFSVESGQGIFLSITDIHFDPFADSSIVKQLDESPISQWHQIFKNAADQDFADYGSDANNPLMRSALNVAKQLPFEYDYILYSGDYLSHEFHSTYNRLVGGSDGDFQNFTLKTMTYVSDQLSSRFPGTPIFGTLGNNDSICGDYMISPDGAFLEGISTQWARLSGQANAFNDFRYGGFYKVRHPTVPNHDIIVLNSIFWSTNYQESCATANLSPGEALMNWLGWELFKSSYDQHAVTLLMHIPPGINAYSTARGFGSCQNRITSFWADNYTDGFLKLLQQYDGVVVAAFAGHTHMDDFKVITAAEGGTQIPLQITPSVSPIFDNNPAFKVIKYDRSNGHLIDSATYNLSNLDDPQPANLWQLEYVASRKYNLSDLSGQSLTALNSQIVSDGSVRDTFMSLYASETPRSSPITGQNWQAFTCAQTNITKEDFADCYCSQGN